MHYTYRIMFPKEIFEKLPKKVQQRIITEIEKSKIYEERFHNYHGLVKMPTGDFDLYLANNDEISKVNTLMRDYFLKNELSKKIDELENELSELRKLKESVSNIKKVIGEV